MFERIRAQKKLVSVLFNSLQNLAGELTGRSEILLHVTQT